MKLVEGKNKHTKNFFYSIRDLLERTRFVVDDSINHHNLAQLSDEKNNVFV